MKQIAIIGAGVAGIEAASIVSKNNFQVILFEKENDIAGNIMNKARLFPDFSLAVDLVDKMRSKINHPNISLQLNSEIIDIVNLNNEWELTDKKGTKYKVDTVLLATGYTPFDATLKEELGYGIYNGVITSLDLEKMFQENRILNSLDEPPGKIVFLQCVGSRDEKTGNDYCSKICCVTAVKQAIEAAKLLPDAEIYVFYMDLRMWGQSFEELYREAQETYGVKFVRGRISEAASTFDGKIQIKAEDTLVGTPLKMTTDFLVLMVGMEASPGTKALSHKCGIDGPYGFALGKDRFLEGNKTTQEGLFVAGSAKRPMSISDAIADGRSAACTIIESENKLN